MKKRLKKKIKRKGCVARGFSHEVFHIVKKILYVIMFLKVPVCFTIVLKLQSFQMLKKGDLTFAPATIAPVIISLTTKS